MFAKFKSAVSERFDGDRAAAPSRRGAPLQFERLETRENPAGQADAIVWGAGWQEYHIGANNHLHIQYSNGSGPVQSVDLSAAIGSSTKFSVANAPVVATTFGNRPYVFARAMDAHLHAFYWTGSQWSEANLSQAAAVAEPVQSVQIAAHVWNGVPHVFFLGANDRHVHELYWSAATGWKGVDLTAVSGSPALAESAGSITALVTSANTEHVYYQGSNNHLRELSWTSNAGWKDADIGALAQPMSSVSYELSAFAVGARRFVYYQGSNNHVYQMSLGGPGLFNSDLNALAAGSVPMRAGSDLQAYYRDGRFTVSYIGSDNHVHSLTYGQNAMWTTNDLTTSASAPNANQAGFPSVSGALTSLIYNNTEILFFADATAHMSRLFTVNPSLGWQYVKGPLF